MKFLTVVLMIFFINVAASLVNTIEYTSGYSIQPSQTWIDDVGQKALIDAEYFQSSAVQDASSNFGFGDFVKGFSIFVGTFAYGIVVVPYTMTQFDMDPGIAIILSVPVYILYGLAITQFISNRSAKAME